MLLKGWPDRWDLAELLRAKKALSDALLSDRIAAPVVGAVKHLGVVTGSNKDLHQGRLKGLFTCTKRVGVLSLEQGERERLVAGSALPAALYGCKAQPPDKDTIDVARRRVNATAHKGSHFCQTPLFFQASINAWRSDPAVVWLVGAGGSQAHRQTVGRSSA